jgi:hypothetical protein
MAIYANSQDLQIDAAALLDPLFIPTTEGLIIFRCSRRHVDILSGNVDIFKKMLVHKIVLTLGMLFSQADVLIEIESGDLRKVDFTLAEHPNQFPVQADMSVTSSQPQHGVGLGVQDLGNCLGCCLTQFVVIFFDDDFHRFPRGIELPGPCRDAILPTSRSRSERCRSEQKSSGPLEIVVKKVTLNNLSVGAAAIAVKFRRRTDNTAIPAREPSLESFAVV